MTSPLGVAILATLIVLVVAFGWVTTRPGEAAGAPDAEQATRAEPDSLRASIEDVNQDGHLRVLFLGDSLVQRASEELTAAFTPHGVEVEFRGYTATGLLTQLPEDGGATWWASELRDSLATFAPDVVVIEACCNYDGTFHSPGTTVLVPDTEAHYARWRAEAVALTDEATAASAEVYWVLSPSELSFAKVDWAPTRVERFNEIYRTLGTPLIDWRSALDSASKGVAGELRDEDGVHLNNAGDLVVAAETWRVLTDHAG